MVDFMDKAGNNDIVGATMDITERQVAEEAIRRSEAYLAEAQKLSHTGSFGWIVSSGEIFWSDETLRIFERDPKTTPTLKFALSRVHPDDRELVQGQMDRTFQMSRWKVCVQRSNPQTPDRREPVAKSTPKRS